MKNILVIEDSKTINNIIHKELTSLNFKVSQAFTFADAKEFLATKKYQLIILDLHLPDGEGSELIAHIQSLTKTKVVVLTSTQDEELREELFGYGILDYIIKDTNLLYSIQEIVKIINTITLKAKEKILIIDDSKFICKQVRTILEPRNYVVKSAFNAGSGLEKLQKEHFNLIILDMELPDMHGIKVLELIRKESQLLSIPVIVLSGTSTPEIIRNVLKNGANDFLKKPFVFEEFILKIDLWINYFKKERELKEKTFKLQFINDNLEKLVFEEVQKSRQKDKIMFTQSRQAQMGEMIAMIAHQWRQPLNAIAAATSVISLKAQMNNLDNATARDVASKIYKHIQYLSSTIDDFRDFFKPQKEMKSSNFELILTKALTLTQDSLKNKHITLNVNVNNNPTFMSYENELVQVILNLLKNAEIALIDREIHDPKIEITINTNSLEILDNAGGISNDIIDKIFDPYFSTKGDKNGTGLGLYMSKIIVEEHCRGKLVVQNIQDGAKFTITLPQGEGVL